MALPQMISVCFFFLKRMEGGITIFCQWKTAGVIINSLFYQEMHCNGSCLLDVNIIEIWLFGPKSRNRYDFFNTNFRSWSRREGERMCVRLSRLSPTASEQLVPGAECLALSPTKPHQFILACKCMTPLTLQPWINASFLFRNFYGEQWATL